MLAGASHSSHRQGVPRDLLGPRSPGRAGRSLEPWNTLMGPELVELPCPESRCSPVEVLKKIRGGRRFLWCPQCRAIWAVNLSTSPTDPAPWVIAFGPSSMRRPL
jgi:hypothetical protein